jgi:SAM-dependent methyltransferase
MEITQFKLNKTIPLGIKKGTEYWQDMNGIIFSDPIDQNYMIGGGHEEGRNKLENHFRIARIKQLKPNGQILDFGCGNGLLVKDLKDSGFNVTGYDKFHKSFDTLPEPNSADVVTMIEVIEHLCEPFEEIDLIYQSLKPDGVVMIETSFTDWLTINDDYINPDAGHNTVWSHKGLTEMMTSKGFKEGQHFNRNVRIYIK